MVCADWLHSELIESDRSTRAFMVRNLHVTSWQTAALRLRIRDIFSDFRFDIFEEP